MNKLFQILIIVSFFSCANHQKVTEQKYTANEPFIIYKTKADYYNNVPVVLNDDKTIIVSYPDPSDVIIGKQLMTPTLLKNDYLLDRRGISTNVAFTSFTYDEYAKLTEAPSIQELLNNIIDNDPLMEYYNCRNKIAVKNDLKKVNKLVKSNFKDCIKLK